MTDDPYDDDERDAELARLYAEIERLLTALERIAVPDDGHSFSGQDANWMWDTAREALEAESATP